MCRCHRSLSPFFSKLSLKIEYSVQKIDSIVVFLHRMIQCETIEIFIVNLFDWNSAVTLTLEELSSWQTTSIDKSKYSTRWGTVRYSHVCVRVWIVWNMCAVFFHFLFTHDMCDSNMLLVCWLCVLFFRQIIILATFVYRLSFYPVFLSLFTHM